MVLKARIKNRSLIERNKKKTYGQDLEYRRWAGSSINFEEPDTEKIEIKLSKDYRKKFGEDGARRSVSIDFWKNVENPNDARLKKKLAS